MYNFKRLYFDTFLLVVYCDKFCYISYISGVPSTYIARIVTYILCICMIIVDNKSLCLTWSYVKIIAIHIGFQNKNDTRRNDTFWHSILFENIVDITNLKIANVSQWRRRQIMQVNGSSTSCSRFRERAQNH